MLQKKIFLLCFQFSIIIIFTSCTGSLFSQQEITYTWRDNDTIEKVARIFHIKPSLILEKNEIYDPLDLVEGMNIIVPNPANVSYSNSHSYIRNSSRSLLTGQTNVKLIWPVKGTISSGYGKRHGRYHYGLDLTSDNGRDIRAAANGIVKFAGRKSGYGKTIILDHGNGLETLYAHNQKLFVQKGAFVQQNTPIAEMGATGKASGIHLHFEVRQNNRPQNPLRYLPIR